MTTPIHLITPPARREALQQRLSDLVPRYASANPYHTSGALAIVEKLVRQEFLPEWVIESDTAILGILAFRAMLMEHAETQAKVLKK